MSESHGSVLTLKRYEDLGKVVAYVKQQVREEHLELFFS